MHSFLVSSTHLSDTPAHSAHPPPTHCLLRLSKEGNKRLSIGEAWQYQFFLQNFQGGWGDHFLFVEAKLDCEMPKHVKNCNFFNLKLAPQGRISSLIFNWLYLWFRSGLAFLSWLNALSHRIFFSIYDKCGEFWNYSTYGEIWNIQNTNRMDIGMHWRFMVKDSLEIAKTSVNINSFLGKQRLPSDGCHFVVWKILKASLLSEAPPNAR